MSPLTTTPPPGAMFLKAVLALLDDAGDLQENQAVADFVVAAREQAERLLAEQYPELAQQELAEADQLVSEVEESLQ